MTTSRSSRFKGWGGGNGPRPPDGTRIDVTPAFTSEREFQEAVVLLARDMGILVAHLPNAGSNRKMLDNQGFPDLVLAKGGDVKMLELKVKGGRVTEEQQKWVRATGAHVVYPHDWDAIVQIMERMGGRV